MRLVLTTLVAMARLSHTWPWLVLALANEAVAQPGMVTAELDTADVFTYRSLQRDDFRAQHPPKPFLASVELRPVAVSCVYLVVDPRSRIFAESVRTDDGPRYRARISELRFAAMFSRSCSWWNLEHSVSPAYVLAHEQIHFAIFEVAARKLNKAAPGLVASLDFELESPEAIVNAVQQRVQAELSRAMAEVGKQNLQFDQATSFGFRPQAQDDWNLRLEGDLRGLARFAVTSPTDGDNPP